MEDDDYELTAKKGEMARLGQQEDAWAERDLAFRAQD